MDGEFGGNFNNLWRESESAHLRHLIGALCRLLTTCCEGACTRMYVPPEIQVLFIEVHTLGERGSCS